jgi:hypothetical protein
LCRGCPQIPLDDYAIYEAAKRGMGKFLHDVDDEIWYNDLKNSNTFYTKVTAIDIMAFLDANTKAFMLLT